MKFKVVASLKEKEEILQNIRSGFPANLNTIRRRVFYPCGKNIFFITHDQSLGDIPYLGINETGDIKGISVNSITLNETTIGWMFCFPENGKLTKLKDGCLFVRQLRINSIVSTEMEGDYKRAKLEVYLTHADYVIVGADNGNVLILTHDTTSIQAQ